MTASSRTGGQTVTVKETVAAGLQRRYRITSAASQPTVGYDTVVSLDSGWAAFPAGGQIAGTQGQVCTVVDCTLNGANARAKGTVTLPAPTPVPTPTVIEVSPDTATIPVGASVTFSVKVLPADAPQTVTATAKDPDVITIQNTGGGANGLGAQGR